MTHHTDIDQVLAHARARGVAAASTVERPDYAAVNIDHRKRRAALTRAINSRDPEQIKRTVIATVRAWRQPPYNGFWPDDWSRWQIALDDAMNPYERVLLEDIR